MISFKLNIRIALLFSVIALQATAQSSITSNSYVANPNLNRVEEKLYVHTDKDFYLCGEIVWFKVYYSDENYRPLKFSKICYVEVVDRNAKPIAQAKVAIDARGGSGSFYLPLGLSSDHYTLRAYTSWMKNDGEESFFNKTISIANTINLASTEIKEDTQSIANNFFPESGQMIQDIPATVAFRLNESNGKGIPTSGVIMDNKGDTVSSFSSKNFGIGRIEFTPVAGRKYMASFKLPDGRSLLRALPDAQADGFVMHVVDNMDDRYKASVWFKPKADESTVEAISLITHTSNSSGNQQQGRIKALTEYTFFIPKKAFEDGVNYITLFDHNGQPVAERLIFIRPAKKELIKIQTSKPSYAAREKVAMQLAMPEKSQADSINYSISVYQLDSLSTMGTTHIDSYRWLLSSLQGQIENPEYYFSSAADVDEATDNLLLTHGWRKFNTNKSAPVITNRPELLGHLLSARVFTRADNKPAPDLDCFLSVPSIPYGFYVNRADSTGVVQFDLSRYYGQGDIVIRVLDDVSNKYRVDVINPFSDAPSSNSAPGLLLSSSLKNNLMQRSISMQVQNVYKADSLRHFITPSLSDTLPFYGRAEYSYPLDNYKRFTTMEEVLREYVQPIAVTGIGDRLRMGMFDEVYQAKYNQNILVLLDGVALSDYNQIFKYDPLKVRKLEVVPRRYIIGPATFLGVASFETYQGKFDGFELDPGTILVNYEGLQLKREFYAPDYEKTASNKRVPDLRTTLQWLPDNVSSFDGTKNINFFTSDTRGHFMIVLEGLTDNGNAVYSTASFEVQ